jgi:acyl dehydratase
VLAVSAARCISMEVTNAMSELSTPPDSVITDDMRRQIGIPTEPWIVACERGAISRYADAIGDPNPIYRDEDYARETAYGTVVAPPIFLGWPVSQGRSARVDSPFFRHVTGGVEVIYERPVRAGEKLVATAKLADLYEKTGRPGVGRMLFQILETTYRDLNGKVVAIKRTTDITFEGGEGDD